MTVTATTPTDNVVTVGDQAFDIGTPLGALEYIILMSVDNKALMNDDIADLLANKIVLKWDNARVADALKERCKANARAIYKDENKIDWAARFTATVKLKFGDKGITYDKTTEMIAAYINVMNAGITAFNAANPDANLQLYKLDSSSGKTKSKAGGRGEGRSYNTLAKLFVTHAALWNEQPISIDYDARLLSYPYMIENNVPMIQYTGKTYTTFIDTRDDRKVKPCSLVNGTLYPLGKLNQLNTWANGANVDDNGKAAPVAAPNSWVSCTLPGITITNMTETIKAPTLAQFYDHYATTDEKESDNVINGE